MNKELFSKPLAPLKTLGIVGLIFFVMAFECGDDNGGGGKDTGGGETVRQTKTRGGACSTEEEFKAIITKQKTFLDRDYEQSEVVFNSFEVTGPMHYQNMTEGFSAVTDDAYRVVTSFDKITRGDEMRTNKVYRTRFENAVIMFYPYGSRDECKHFYEKNGFPTENRKEITEQY